MKNIHINTQFCQSKTQLKLPSVNVLSCIFQTNFNLHTNSMDQDQTALSGSWPTMFVYRGFIHP